MYRRLLCQTILSVLERIRALWTVDDTGRWKTRSVGGTGATEPLSTAISIVRLLLVGEWLQMAILHSTLRYFTLGITTDVGVNVFVKKTWLSPKSHSVMLNSSHLVWWFLYFVVRQMPNFTLGNTDQRNGQYTVGVCYYDKENLLTCLGFRALMWPTLTGISWFHTHVTHFNWYQLVPHSCDPL